MGSPWPAPSADDQVVRRGPNYALRRAVVALVIVAVIGAGIAWWVGRGGSDDDGEAGTEQWDTLVLQDERTGKLTLVDPQGEEIDTFRTDLHGLLDVGLADRLIVGVAGDPTTDGLGVIDLESGEVTPIEVETHTISRLDASPYLLASGGPRDPLALVDVAAGEVIDLLSFAENDDPIVSPGLVRIDPSHAHVAYTELGELETVLVDVEARTSSSLAGTLADLGDDAVLTLTNRGATSLADLYGLDGERVGTVETDAAAGGLVLDDRSALVITRSGRLVHVDFDDESVDELGSVAEHLVGDSSGESASGSTDGTDADLVRTIVPILDRTRLAVLSRQGMVVIDVEGNTIATDRMTDPAVARPATSTDRCVLIGGKDSEQTLWDVTDGTRIETFDPGFLTGRSADGCTVTYAETAAPVETGDSTVPDGTSGTTGTSDTEGTSATSATSGAGDRPGGALARLVGPEVNQRVDGELGAVAPNGRSAIGRDDEGAFILDAESGDRTDVAVDTLFAVFIDR
ncbi:MAG: hypothetical protein AB7L17_11800 [Ilumatobacteraceae bacterium]